MGKVLVSNPPFNMKWSKPPFAQIQERFIKADVPPESNANFAFILSGLQLCDRCVFILPNSVLNGGTEAEYNIRKCLVESNFLEAVIICPGNMFESTDIPTCILVLDKHKETATIEMLDMRQKYETEIREQAGQFGGKSHTNRIYKKEVNVFTDEIMDDAISCISEKRDIPGYCKSVTIKEVADGSYELAPSRYIKFNEKEHAHRQHAEIVADINRIISEKNACKMTINETLAKALGFDTELYKKDQSQDDLNILLKKLGVEPLVKSDYFRTTKNKNEIKFENNSKDALSSVLMMILGTWKQHIYYLNLEENRYLAELRDALLPDLMSGKIEV